MKEALKRTAAKCLHPEVARELIRENVKKTLKKKDSIKLFTFEPPVEILVMYTNARMAIAVNFMPSAERLDGKTIRIVQDDYLKAFGALRASLYIVGAVST